MSQMFSTSSAVSVEVSKALTAMDVGPEITRVWNELDHFIATVVLVHSARERVIDWPTDLADRMVRLAWQKPCFVENGTR